MNGIRRIFIAATDQNIGKTTTTLGMLFFLKKLGINVGYCKPIGQKYVSYEGKKVDKDAELFAYTLGFDLIPQYHSPIIASEGYTWDYIQNPQHEKLVQKINKAAAYLERNYDFVVYEGTGHPGVGSIFGLSNADVAKQLNAGVVLVVQGGIGNTIDRLLLCKSLFDIAGVPFLGVIINKVIPEKMEKITVALTQKLSELNIPILGIIPFEETLAYPLVATVAKHLNAEILCNPHNLNSLVQGTIAGSLIDLQDLNEQKQYLLVVSIRRLNDALQKLNAIWHAKAMDTPNLAGIILTGDAEIAPENLEFLKQHQIPALKVHIDTYEAIKKLGQLDVKLNPQVASKVRRAADLFEDYVDTNAICQLIGHCP